MSNGDIRVLIDWDRNGHILIDGNYGAGAVNLLPRRLPYSNVSITSVTPTFRTITSESPLLLTASEIQAGDTLIIGTSSNSDPNRFIVTPSISTYVFKIYSKKLTGTDGGLTFTIRQYNSAGTSIATSTSNLSGLPANTEAVNTIAFTTLSTAAYVRLEIVQNGTNDTSDWEFYNFYMGTTPMGSGRYVGPEASKYEVITDRVLSVDWSIGGDDPWDWVMRDGSATVLLDNDDDFILPEGSGSIFGSLLAATGSILIIQTEYDGSWYNLWSGYVEDIEFTFELKKLKTIEISCSQNLSKTRDVLYPLNSYDSFITTSTSATTRVDQITTEAFVPPNLTEYLQALYGVYVTLIKGTITATGQMALKPSWRSDGVPLWYIFKFLAIAQVGYVFIDENGEVRIKTRPTAGGTTISVNPSTQVNSAKYIFGYKFGGGMRSTHSVLDTTQKSSTIFRQFATTSTSNILNGQTASATYTLPEPGDYSNFIVYQRVFRTAVWDHTTDENTVFNGSPNGQSFFSDYLIRSRDRVSLWNASNIVFTTTCTQLSPTTVKIDWQNSSGGTVTVQATVGPPVKFEARCADAQDKTSEVEFRAIGAATDLPLQDIDFTYGVFITPATDATQLPIYSYWRDHFAEQVGFIKTLSLKDRPDNSTWLQRILDLRPGTLKIIDMNMSAILPGVANRRHHVMGYKGSYSPSQGLDVHYDLYR